MYISLVKQMTNIMHDIFNDITNSLVNSSQLLNEIYLTANKRYVCNQINATGWLHKEPEEIPDSWGITAQTLQPTLDRLVSEYIEYRTTQSTETP